jgi:vitamin B12 transporter
MKNRMRGSEKEVIDKGPDLSRGNAPCRAPLVPAGGRRRRARVMTAFFISFLLFPLFVAAAQEQPNGGRTEVALQDSTKTDLLLFWEEKELYVETATRIEKPLSQVAENITVITAREIEEMNAHSVAEVLNRVTGMFVNFMGRDFVTSSLLSIQGSEARHVTVLLDGVVWNFLGDGNAETFSIPVGIIDRIEIIKGPASSAWGSALGGVVNIITRETGGTVIPKGVVSASYGEANSQDYSMELSGRGGKIGYYLHAGKQMSDGLRDHRDYDRDSLYGKVSVAPMRDLDLLFTIGYSDPFISGGDNPGRPADSKTDLSTLFFTGAMDYRLTPDLGLKGALRYLRNRFDQPVSAIGSGELLRGINIDEETVSGDLRLTYTGGMHTAVLGTDISHGTMDDTTIYGDSYQAALKVPPRVLVSPDLFKWAVFANDTLDFGKLAITPGIRYDHNNVSGSFVSPSIGATYELAEHTIARVSVARGFTSPPLVYTSVGGYSTLPNPALNAEYGWSYQVGVESGITDYLNAKVTLFRHDMQNAIVLDATVPTAKIYRNGGDVTRQGYELEAETVPVCNLSLKAGHAYVHKDATFTPDWKVNYSILAGIKYDDRKSLMAQLTGYYTWWDMPAVNNARYNNFIWDLNLNKKFVTSAMTTVEVFLTVRNLFSGANYLGNSLPNAGRWVEGGIRFRF